MIKLNKQTKVNCNNDVYRAFIVWKHNNDKQTMPLHRYIFLHNYPDDDTIKQKTFKIYKTTHVPIKLNCKLSYDSLKTAFSFIVNETQTKIGRVCIYRIINGICNLKIIELNKNLNGTISLYTVTDNNSISRKLYVRLPSDRSIYVSKIKEYNSFIKVKSDKRVNIKLLMGLVIATHAVQGAGDNIKKYTIDKLNKLYNENNNIFNIRSLSELTAMKNINIENCSFTIKIYKPYYIFDYVTQSYVKNNKITEYVYHASKTNHLIDLEFKKHNDSTNLNYSNYLLEKNADIEIGSDYICRIRVS